MDLAAIYQLSCLSSFAIQRHNSLTSHFVLPTNRERSWVTIALSSSLNRIIIALLLYGSGPIRTKKSQARAEYTPRFLTIPGPLSAYTTQGEPVKGTDITVVLVGPIAPMTS